VKALFSLSKKKGIFDIQIEQPIVQMKKQQVKRNDIKIEQALSVILKQLERSK